MEIPTHLQDEIDEWHRRFVLYNLPQQMWIPIVEFALFGHEPGDFLCAVLQNNLTAAALHADDINKPKLHLWAQFMFNSLPSTAWGSPAKVKAHIEKGGMTAAAIPYA